MKLNPTAASLLGFLLEEPKTGWDIVASVEDSIGCFWNLTKSQVYRELRSLADAGLVEGGERGTREKRPYAITDAGRQAFASWLRQDPGDDVIRMQGLLKFFFGDQLDRKTLERFVTLSRLEHERQLTEFKEILPEVEAAGVPVCAHTLRFGIRYYEMVLEWLDQMPLDALPPTTSEEPARA
jgi:DNA-binding PadR family transcriptional regulator